MVYFNCNNLYIILVNIADFLKLSFIIKNIFFAFLLIGSGIFILIEADNSKLDNSVLLFMAISFFLGAAFLIYKSLPKTDLIIEINRIAKTLHLDKIFFILIFLGTVIFGLKYIIENHSLDLLKIVILSVFAFIGIRGIYNLFFD